MEPARIKLANVECAKIMKIESNRIVENELTKPASRESNDFGGQRDEERGKTCFIGKTCDCRVGRGRVGDTAVETHTCASARTPFSPLDLSHSGPTRDAGLPPIRG